MIALSTIKTILEGTKLPVTYLAWPEGKAPALPWIAYRCTATDNMAADGIAYAVVDGIDIELYSRTKDPTSEALVEKALTDGGIYWDKREEYLENEKVIEVIYEIEV